MARAIMRTLLLGLLVAAALPACATSGSGDEFAGESSADGEDGKGDAAAAFTYFNVTAATDGFDVARANRSTTQCGRGFAQPTCKTFSIDWTGTAMPASVAQSYEQMLKDGTPLLVRGTLSPDPADAGSVLAVKEIWVPNKADDVDGVFALVHDNGIRCVRAPCPSLTERKLNSTLSAQLTSVDLADSGANQDAIDLAMGELFDDGLIVVGYRDYDSLGGKTRTANKFFTRAPVPLF
jgi:hypothetical protein